MEVVITFFKEEFLEAKKLIKIEEEFTKNKRTFALGTYKDKKVLVVLSNMGKANAAFTVGMTFEMYKEISKIIVLGIAGGFGKVNIGDVYYGSHYYYGDFDLTASESFNYGDCFEFKGFLKPTLKYPKQDGAILVTSDSFIHGPFQAKNILKLLNITENKVLFDMESTVVAHLCHELNIPFLAIRAVSDIIGAHDQITSFKENEKKALKALTIGLEKIFELN